MGRRALLITKGLSCLKTLVIASFNSVTMLPNIVELQGQLLQYISSLQGAPKGTVATWNWMMDLIKGEIYCLGDASLAITCNVDVCHTVKKCIYLAVQTRICYTYAGTNKLQVFIAEESSIQFAKKHF